ncbi:MAG: hypothetical protein ACLGIK_13640, partial [Gemmatimonadota bacterium]
SRPASSSPGRPAPRQERDGDGFPLGRAAAHFLHSVTPFMLQITQMKVPHPLQGYPSEARSSLPQARQIIASCSCSVLIAVLARVVSPP